ncbi:hypothetical protein O181_073664 [Austropuccinia psidii MF-1]|uniref:Uncharacterized protein n=1 Tax=Austropuccinia psidii MF-1 TaxID=1389203 RepID=A0A9Q3ICP4_9BASI|nr:hypothetical protein [Austropuccinia psidii MF-1]
MEPAFKGGDQVLVSTLNFSNLKGPRKMRDSFLGPFTIVKLIGKMQWKSDSQRNFLGNTQYSQKIRLNGKDQRQYSVRFKNQTADKEQWLAENAIPDGNLHLRRFRASRRAEQSHQ